LHFHGSPLLSVFSPVIPSRQVEKIVAVAMKVQGSAFYMNGMNIVSQESDPCVATNSDFLCNLRWASSRDIVISAIDFFAL
jgi:hypothetical protein